MLSNRNRNSNSKFGGKDRNRIGTMTPLGAVPKEKKAPKVSVPKPVNLPSMKKEHAGNDPTTQLVGGGGGIHGWQKDGSHDPNSGGMVSGAHHPLQPSILASGSTWGTGGSADAVHGGPQPKDGRGGAGAHPPGRGDGGHTGDRGRGGSEADGRRQHRDDRPVQMRIPSFGDRRLNPMEYPSLQSAQRGDVPKGPSTEDGEQRWADDEREVARMQYGDRGGYRGGHGGYDRHDHYHHHHHHHNGGLGHPGDRDGYGGGGYGGRDRMRHGGYGGGDRGAPYGRDDREQAYYPRPGRGGPYHEDRDDYDGPRQFDGYGGRGQYMDGGRRGYHDRDHGDHRGYRSGRDDYHHNHHRHHHGDRGGYRGGDRGGSYGGDGDRYDRGPGYGGRSDRGYGGYGRGGKEDSRHYPEKNYEGGYEGDPDYNLPQPQQQQRQQEYYQRGRNSHPDHHEGREAKEVAKGLQEAKQRARDDGQADNAEREAFNAELERVAAEQERERERKSEERRAKQQGEKREPAALEQGKAEGKADGVAEVVDSKPREDPPRAPETQDEEPQQQQQWKRDGPRGKAPRGGQRDQRRPEEKAPVAQPKEISPPGLLLGYQNAPQGDQGFSQGPQGAREYDLFGAGDPSEAPQQRLRLTQVPRLLVRPQQPGSPAERSKPDAKAPSQGTEKQGGDQRKAGKQAQRPRKAAQGEDPAPRAQAKEKKEKRGKDRKDRQEGRVAKAGRRERAERRKQGGKGGQQQQQQQQQQDEVPFSLPADLEEVVDAPSFAMPPLLGDLTLSSTPAPFGGFGQLGFSPFGNLGQVDWSVGKPNDANQANVPTGAAKPWIDQQQREGASSGAEGQGGDGDGAGGDQGGKGSAGKPGRGRRHRDRGRDTRSAEAGGGGDGGSKAQAGRGRGRGRGRDGWVRGTLRVCRSRARSGVGVTSWVWMRLQKMWWGRRAAT